MNNAKGKKINYLQWTALSLVFLFLSFFYHSLYAASPTFTYQIQGITGNLFTNAQSALNNAIKNKGKLTPTAIHQLYQQAPQLIQQALQPYGYFKSQVNASYTQKDDQLQAVFAVNPGSVLLITQVDVRVTGAGKNDPKIQKLLQNFPLKVGQPLETPNYEKAKRLLFDTAEQEGYITAQLTTHTVEVNRNFNTAVVKLYLDTGPRFYFGPITFKSTGYQFDPAFLQRFSPFAPGQPFSSDQLLTLQDNLSGSRYFQQVSVESLREQAVGNQVPIQVNLTPLAASQYTAGAGYGTDTGPRATLGANWRHVTNTGQSFSNLLSLSQIQDSFQTTYTIPGENPTTDQYNINGSWLQNDLQQGSSYTKQVGFSGVNTQGNWQRTLSLNYMFERFKFTNIPNQTAQNSNLLIPAANWVYLNADNPIYTTHGNRFSLQVQGAYQPLISNTSFAQTQITDKWIDSFNDDSRILLRGNLGYTTVHDITVFPLSLRFYAGGSQSIRGYSYDSLGPGRYLAVGSAEYQHLITGKWYGAAFIDAGNADNHIDMPIEKGVGVGIVWISPLGPMELSIAKAVSKPGQPNQIQFVMGPDLG